MTNAQNKDTKKVGLHNRTTVEWRAQCTPSCKIIPNKSPPPPPPPLQKWWRELCYQWVGCDAWMIHYRNMMGLHRLIQFETARFTSFGSKPFITINKKNYLRSARRNGYILICQIVLNRKKNFSSMMIMTLYLWSIQIQNFCSSRWILHYSDNPYNFLQRKKRTSSNTSAIETMYVWCFITRGLIKTSWTRSWCSRTLSFAKK